MDNGTREWMRETIALKHDVLTYAEKQINSDLDNANELYATAKSNIDIDVAYAMIAKCAQLMCVICKMRNELDHQREVTE